MKFSKGKGQGLPWEGRGLQGCRLGPGSNMGQQYPWWQCGQDVALKARGGQGLSALCNAHQTRSGHCIWFWPSNREKMLIKAVYFLQNIFNTTHGQVQQTTSKVVLGWIPWPGWRGCGTRAGSAGRRDSFGGTQQHLLHQQEGIEKAQLDFSQQCVVGGQESAAQAEILGSQSGDSEKPFPHKDSPAVGTWPRKAGPPVTMTG